MRGISWPTWIAALVGVAALLAYIVNRAALALSLGFAGWLLDVATAIILLGVPAAGIVKVLVIDRAKNG